MTTTSSRSYIGSLVTLILNQALSMSAMALVLSIGGIVGYEIAPSKDLATLPLSAQVVGTFVMLFPASYLSQWLGRRNGFLLGAAIGIVGGVVAYFGIQQQQFWLFCLGLLLVGFQNAFAQYFRFSAIDITPPERRSQAISLVMGGGVIAAFVGPLLARLSRTALPIEFSAAGITIALLCLAQFLLFLCFYQARPFAVPSIASNSSESASEAAVDASPEAILSSGTEQYRESLEEPSWKLLTRLPFMTAVLSGAIGFGTMVLIMNATPLAMEQEFGLSFDKASVVIQWHIFAMYIPSFVTGRIIQAIGSLATITLGLVGLLLCIGLASIGDSYSYFLSALVLLGVGWNFSYISASYLLTHSITDRQTAFAQGFNDTVIYLCNTLGSLSSGILFARFGWNVLVLSILPILALNGGVLLLCYLNHRTVYNRFSS